MADEAGTYEQLVNRHQGLVLRVCRAVLRDEHLGHDAAQDTFLRLWRKLQEPERPERWDAWLRTVAVRCAVDHSRKTQGHSRSVASAPTRPPVEIDEAEFESPASSSPLEGASIAELESVLEQALHRLPEGQRTVFVLRHSAGLPLSEIAECLRLKLPTVKTQFARACLKLQRALRHYREDEQ